MRQARNYFYQIPEVEKMFSGEEGKGSSGGQDWDINAIFEEASDLNLKPPAR
jgi:hypothetical protein